MTNQNFAITTITRDTWISRFHQTCQGIFELEGERQRNDAMEGVRGFAVLLVFYVHYHTAFEGYLDHGSWQYAVSYFLSEVGHCGVDLFFVLSGYLIYAASLKPNLSIGKFWRRRIQRIYPTFLVVFCAYLMLSFIFPERSKFPENQFELAIFLAGNLFLVAGLFPITPLITVAWSLSFEITYYLLMPLIAVTSGMVGMAPRYRKLLLLVIAIAFIAMFMAGPFYGAGYWTPARMLMFFVGIALYEDRLSNTIGRNIGPPILWWTLFFLSFPAYFLFHELIVNTGQPFDLRLLTLGKVLVLTIPYYGLLASCFADTAKTGALFRLTPMRWLGNMSYSYYLIHGLTIHMMAFAVGKITLKLGLAAYGGILFWGLLPFVLLATLGVATMLFVIVEKPFSLNKTKIFVR